MNIILFCSTLPIAPRYQAGLSAGSAGQPQCMATRLSTDPSRVGFKCICAQTDRHINKHEILVTFSRRCKVNQLPVLV